MLYCNYQTCLVSIIASSPPGSKGNLNKLILNSGNAQIQTNNDNEVMLPKA